MKNKLASLVIFSTLLLNTGCFKDPKIEQQPCVYDACAFKAPADEVKRVEDYLASKGITAMQHCSGLYYRIETPGTGKTPDACSNVVVTYKGSLTDDTIFDQRTTNFPLNGVIRGWTNGVPLIKEGGKIILYIPPSLGYGSRDVRDNNGALAIPANSILVFEIALSQVQ